MIMKTIEINTKHITQQIDKDEKPNLPGYPLYPDSEDVFHKNIIEMDIDPDDVSKTKAPNERNKVGKNNKKDFINDKSGKNLDIPGSELDDEQENIGSEDEENNYYSLGGDDHNDLDENKGE